MGYTQRISVSRDSSSDEKKYCYSLWSVQVFISQTSVELTSGTFRGAVVWLIVNFDTSRSLIAGSFCANVSAAFTPFSVKWLTLSTAWPFMVAV
jgi:hypothetical protein